jgi:hypothetical protein
VIVLVATEILGPGRASALARAASETGAAGIHVGASALLGDVPAIASEAIAAGLALPSITLPLGERAPAPGKRLPYLAAAQPDERLAALGLARAGLAAGADFGIARVLVDFGPVTLPVPRAEVARRHRRAELGDGEPGAPLLEAALSARKAQAGALFDAGRFSLERLAREAEARGARLLLPVAGTPWGFPSPRETEALLDAFRGAPLAAVWDPGELSVLRALGLALSDERARALAAGAGAAVERDAVGIDAAYLPGLGERDEALPARAELAGDAPVIVTGNADATVAEIREAVERVTARYA